MSSRLENEARGLLGKNYGKGSLTTKKLLGNLKIIARFMESQGLQSIKHMKTKHVEKFFDSKRALSASTLANYATVMREIAKAIGKQNIVPKTNAELGISRADRYNPKEGDRRKMAEVREKLFQKGEWHGLADQMREAFGLREKESLLSHLVVIKEGKPHLDVKGTKNGRPRQVEIKNDRQWEVLKRVQAHIAQVGGTSLIPPGKTLKQGLKSESNAVSRSGGTKANKANAHLHRHHYAQELARNGASDEKIVEDLGHSRVGSKKHYLK